MQTSRRPGPPAGALAAGAALAAVAAALFLPVRTFDFVGIDDLTYVANNPAVNQGLTARGLREAFTGFHAGNWGPLAWISHMLDVQLFGLRPGAHHLVSLALHAANAALLLLLVRAATAAPWSGALVAALFALHPLHVESFAWVAERKDVLCAFFWLAAAAGHVAYARRPTPPRYAAVLLLAALALLSKPMALTLPAALLLLDYWPLARLGPAGRGAIRRGAVLLEKVPLLVLSALVAVAAFAAQARGGALDAGSVYPLATRLANAALSYGVYLLKLAWPAGLSVFYPMRVPPAPAAAASAGLLLLLSAAALALARRRPSLFVGWSLYVGTLAPAIGIVQVGSHARADRFTYLPAIGIFLAAAWAARDFLPPRGARRAAAAGALIVAVALLAGAARRQALFWKDTTTLFAHALAVDRENYMGHFHVGNARLRAGDAAAAAAHYREALRLRPDYAEAGNNLGAALAAQGRLEEALAAYRGSAVFSRDPATTGYNIALVLEDLGRHDESRRELQRLVERHPGFAPARARLQSLAAGRAPARR